MTMVFHFLIALFSTFNRNGTMNLMKKMFLFCSPFCCKKNQVVINKQNLSFVSKISGWDIFVNYIPNLETSSPYRTYLISKIHIFLTLGCICGNYRLHYRSNLVVGMIPTNTAQCKENKKLWKLHQNEPN